jgi:recombination protein RecA
VLAEQLHAMFEMQRFDNQRFDNQSGERVLPLGVPALDAALPRGGLVQGSVIELQVQGAGGAATSFALCACRAAQQASGPRSSGRHSAPTFEAPRPWCAFIDPSASLFAPGVARLGVELDRLLVVRPELDAIERVAIRIAEAKAVALLVIDLRGALGSLPVSSQRWPRTVRRLALAVRHLGMCVLVITPSEPRPALPLPVAMRLEFSRARAESFEIRVGKERSGRVSPPRKIPWSTFDAAFQHGPVQAHVSASWQAEAAAETGAAS